MLVHVAAFEPKDASPNGVGGFEWRYKAEDADAEHRKDLADLSAAEFHVYRVTAEVTDGADNETITAEIDNSLWLYPKGKIPALVDCRGNSGTLVAE